MPQTRFHKVQEAKEFLASKIVDQARREGAPLSEVERKMLFFSEVGWTLPDMMHVSDEFDREHDQGEYEKKIAQLIENLDKRLQKENLPEYQDWRSAIEFLSPKDHYINVMIGQAGLGHREDSRGLLSIALVVAAVLVCVVLISLGFNFHSGRQHFTGHSATWDDSHNIWMWIWLISIVGVALYTLLRWILGEKRLNALTGRALKVVFGFGKRARL